jgi:hypothetical protein
MRTCSRCGGLAEERFRYCPWCATPLRLKIVEFFRAHRLDRGKALRVSRYLDPDQSRRHIRFSVWSESEEQARAEAAVSLDEEEACRLGTFLLEPSLEASTPTLRVRLERAVTAVRERVSP